MTIKKYNILIVEDEAFLRQTLAYELKRQKNIDSVAAATDGFEAIEFMKNNSVDVVLMDINMPVINGIEATRRIKSRNTDVCVIMLTALSEKEIVFSAFNSGANAYCVKNINTDELLKIIEIVFDGGVWFDKHIAKYVFDILKTIGLKKENSIINLQDYNITQREKEILKLISKGMSNAEIADRLIISLYTVKNHVASIINKLSLKDRTQLAVFALENNLFHKS